MAVITILKYVLFYKVSYGSDNQVPQKGII